MLENDKRIRDRRRRLLGRSVTLLRLFLIASFAILVVGALAVGWSLSTSMRSAALQSERTSLTQYVDGVIGPELVRGNRVVARRSGTLFLDRTRRGAVGGALSRLDAGRRLRAGAGGGGHFVRTGMPD